MCSALVVPDAEPPPTSILYGRSGNCGKCGLCSSAFLPVIFIEVNQYIHFFSFRCLINSALYTLSRLARYGYEITKWSVCSLLSSFALREILFNVYILRNLLLNLRCDLSTILLFLRYFIFGLLSKLCVHVYGGLQPCFLIKIDQLMKFFLYQSVIQFQF